MRSNQFFHNVTFTYQTQICDSLFDSIVVHTIQFDSNQEFVALDILFSL